MRLSMSKKLKIWIALLTVYLVWGGTYLAIRFAVESIPPLFIGVGQKYDDLEQFDPNKFVDLILK